MARAGQLDMFTRRVRKLPAPHEIKLHGHVVDTLRAAMRKDWFFTHFPSGERRDERTGAKLKRMGLQPGMPDLWLLAPDRRGLHLMELKRHGEHLSEEQKIFQEWAVTHGYPHVVVDDLRDAVAVLKSWGALRGIDVW